MNLNPGSYDLKTFAASTEGEIRRLEAQVDLFWSRECALLERWGVQDSMRILDCGCGQGVYLERLHQRFPSARLSGLEIDPVLAGIARERTAAWSPPADIISASLQEAPLPLEALDVIVVRLVLEHLPDPVDALRRLLPALCPGGMIIVIDNDFDYHLRTDPPVAELDALYQAYRAARREQGGDPTIGRRLPAVLTAAGFELTDLETVSVHSALAGDAAFLMAEGAGIPAQLVRDGYLANDVMDSLIRAWGAMLSSPRHSMYRQLFAVLGTRLAPAHERSSKAPSRTPRSVDGEQVNGSTMGPEDTDFRRKWAQTPPEDRWDGLVAHVRAHLATLLGRTASEELDGKGSFLDAGMDSMMMLQFTDHLAKSIGGAFPATLAFEYPTIEALCRHLQHDILGDEPAVAAVDVPTSRVEEQYERLSEHDLESLLEERLKSLGE